MFPITNFNNTFFQRLKGRKEGNKGIKVRKHVKEGKKRQGNREGGDSKAEG